jgi:hypothetical protein
MKRPVAFALAFFLLAPLSGVGAEDGLSLSTQVRTKASLYSTIASPSSFSIGSAAGLDFLLEGSRDRTSFRAGARLSLLQGNEAADLWLALGMPGARDDYLLMAPVFDSAVATPPSALLTLALEELALRSYAGPFSFEAGLSHANWGMGRAFSPADYFTDIDYSSGQPSRRPTLLGKATWYPGPVSSLELVLTPYSKFGQALALRGYTTIFDAVTMAVSAGLREAAGSSAGLLLGGVELSIDLSYLAPYGEAVFILDPGKSWNLQYSIMGGAETRIADLTLMGEYLFAPRKTAVHSIYAAAAWKIDEWFSLTLPLLYIPNPEHLSFGASLSASGFGAMEYRAGLSCEKSAGGDWLLGLSLQASLFF